ncbi:MFS transporter [Streptomyces odontomachi]|uniref:MFS transporter n=1 Tax=Streptomyces odontomachi TaxID=2944940 RepID=UPI0027E23FB7|nr:MFS transporter [Streptomyces sp. ODS25]
MSHALPRPSSEGMPAAPRVNAVVAVLAFGGIVVATMQTLVIPIVPELPRLLNASASDAAWAVTATLLAAAVATPMMGRLGDMFGKRKMLLISLIMLVAGSVTAALSDNLPPMIVGRALQGMASGVIPLGISIMRDELPVERLSTATAVMSASLGVGGALGLPAAAVIAEHFDWHMLFWASAGLGFIAVVLVPILVPESQVRTGGRFDVVGAIGMAAGLSSLLLAISKGADWGWSSRTTLGLFGAAVVILLLWGVFELRSKEPLVDLRTTARRQVLFTNLASIALGFAMFAMSLVLPQLLQMPKETGFGLGQSLLSAGLVMAPSGLVMLALAPVSAALSKAKGPKITLIVGALIVALGYGLNIALMDEVWQLVVVSCVIGAGIGFTYGAMPSLIMAAVPLSETGAANSLNTLMRSIGTSTASAVAGVILAQMTIRLGTFELPSKDGFRTVLVIGAGASVLAAVLAAFIPRHQPAAVTRTAALATAPAPVPDGTTTAAQPAPGTAPVPAQDQPAPPAGTGVNGYVGGVMHGLAGGVRIDGRVHTADGTPVPGAAVTLISPTGRQLGRSVAEGDGAYTVSAPASGSYVLIASAGGYQPQALTVFVSDAPFTYDIQLSGTSGLTGLVRSADDGTPVPGAVVIVTNARGDVLATTETDGVGEFAIPDLVPGTVTLAVNSAHHRALAQPVDVGGTGATRVEIELQSGAHVRGTVRGAGTPLSGARVTLADASGNVVATTTTGADGAYAFSDLEGGAYTVTAAGYPPVAAGLTITGRRIDSHDIELVHQGE